MVNLKKFVNVGLVAAWTALLLIAYAVMVGQDVEAQASSVGINGAPCSYATIQAAINAASDGDTIYIPSGNTYNEVLGLINKDLSFIASSSDCSGPGTAGGRAVIDGGGYDGGAAGGLAVIGAGKKVTFTFLLLRDARAYEGGIFYVDQRATLTLDNCEVFGGYATSAGGGVRVVKDGALILHNFTLVQANNVTGTISGGGGVAVYQGAMTMTSGSSVAAGIGNYSADDGGGIILQDSSLYMDDARISANRATDAGGGVYAFGSSTIELHGESLIGSATSALSNTAAYGGGVYLLGASGLVLYDQSRVLGNAVSGAGGGVYGASGAYVTLYAASTVMSNTASDSGGGAYLMDQDTRLNMLGGGSIVGNEVRNQGGGGIYATAGADVYVDGGQIVSNDANAADGGGIMALQSGAIDPTSVILLNGSVISGNAGYDGGGLHVGANVPSVIIERAHIENNTAIFQGGGIYADATALALEDVRVMGNYAQNQGGGIALFDGAVLTMATSYEDAFPACNPFSLPANTYCSEVSENSSPGWGAGMLLNASSAIISDTAFLNNEGLSDGVAQGAGLMVDRDAHASVTNALFSGNGQNNNNAVHVYSNGSYRSDSSTYAGNQDRPLFAVNTGVVTLTRNIIWGNSDNAYFMTGSTIISDCNDMQQDLGGTNLSVDPQFVTTARGPYRIRYGSPVIDRCYGGLRHDLDSLRRPLDLYFNFFFPPADYDMGAFEAPIPVFAPLVIRN